MNIQTVKLTDSSESGCDHCLKVVIGRTFGSTKRSVRPNYSAELLPCGSAQITELFSAEHRTFFVLHSMAMAPFSHHYWSTGEIAKRMLTEPKLE